MPPHRPLTCAQAAALLGVSHDTVARMADGGEIPSTRTPGGHRRFRRADVEAVRDGTDLAPPSAAA